MIQVNSAAKDANARYSASALDLATVPCFFEDHETQLDPRKTHNPVVDRRVSGQPPQSASENPARLSEDLAVILKPN